MAVELVAKSYSVQTLYFNAIPLKSRFVLLPSLDAPFVPYEGHAQYRPSGTPSRVTNFAVEGVSASTGPSTSKILEPFERLYQVALRDKGIYPTSWYRKQVTNSFISSVLRRVPVQSSWPEGNEVNVLYPLHDERDFQVAVRERHAIPQQHLLKYVASRLPANFRLWVKPHPEHVMAHHTRRLRSISDVPNISFLPPRMPFSQALELCDVVFTLASTLGFEALKVGKPVVCYGSPFYSGRQLTLDVVDPRQIAEKIVSATSFRPDAERFARFLDEMQDVSWPGQFTPLDLSAENMDLLAKGVLDAIETDICN
ncbi:hypothetical protein CH267_04700 [Rhodococcus sp. 06-621-2]|nr:hypothetical protein CH267_04700 [Rhodococcus sp. 06-621-2]